MCERMYQMLRVRILIFFYLLFIDISSYTFSVKFANVLPILLVENVDQTVGVLMIDS